MLFAENLKHLRATKKLSQADFAKEIGVHVTHLSRYERGLSSPSLEVVQKIAEVLNVSIDILVYGENNIENDIKDKELISLFRKTQNLTERQKETVKDFLSAFVLKIDLSEKLK